MGGTQRLARLGEDLAARFLEHQGFRILERNARAGGVEIDLVLARGPAVVFVEVKARVGDAGGRGEEAVDRRKQARLARGALAWLREREVRPRRIGLDVVAIELGPRELSLHHWPDAFDLDGAGGVG